MKMSRLLLPLLFVLSLLSAQQFGAVHALHHAIEDLTQQHDGKQEGETGCCIGGIFLQRSLLQCVI